MGAFEHVISLLSFVYALAITHLLLCIAQMIRNWQRIRFSWFHAFWMVIAFNVIIANWLSYWDLHAIPDWTVGSIVFTFVMAGVNYLQAALVCPEIPAEGTVDLVAFHRDHARQYIGGTAASAAFALIANLAYGGAFNLTEWNAQNAVVIPMLIVAVAATIWRKQWVDIVAVIVMTAAWSYYFVALQSALK